MVSTHLKNISQIGSCPQVGVKIKNVWNHHPVDSYGKLVNKYTDPHDSFMDPLGCISIFIHMLFVVMTVMIHWLNVLPQPGNHLFPPKIPFTLTNAPSLKKGGSHFQRAETGRLVAIICPNKWTVKSTISGRIIPYPIGSMYGIFTYI